MAKKKKKSTEDQMGKLVGVAVSVNPIMGKEGKKDKRKKYQEGKEVKSVPTRQELLDSEKISTEKLDKFRMKLIDEATERKDAVDAHYLRNANYDELEEKLKRREEAKKEAEQRRKEKEMEYNMDEALKKHKNRILSAEGGEMDSQMTMMMMPEESKEEMDMLPDDQMEDQHLDFIINESLDNEEEMYLMEQLQADERLSMIFDKIMDTATEFSGSGPVEGLGTEVSDSIPARLSDGEFVMTAKATDEIGSDNLERMMKDAEEASDNRQRVAMGGEIEKKVDRFGKPIDEDLTAEEIKRSMLSVNPRLR